MCSQSEVKERIEHDSVFFYPLYGGKTFLASESEKILLKKIYDSRTPWAPSRGCPPAPCFTYSSEALQKSFTFHCVTIPSGEGACGVAIITWALAN